MHVLLHRHVAAPGLLHSVGSSLAGAGAGVGAKRGGSPFFPPAPSTRGSPLAVSLVSGPAHWCLGLAVFTRNHKLLVSKLVRYSKHFAGMSDAGLAAMLRARLAPIR